MEKSQMPVLNDDIELSSVDVAELQGEAFESIRQAIAASSRAAISVSENSTPIFYCITPALYQALDNLFEDKALTKIVKEREGGLTIRVHIDDL